MKVPDNYIFVKCCSVYQDPIHNKCLRCGKELEKFYTAHSVEVLEIFRSLCSKFPPDNVETLWRIAGGKLEAAEHRVHPTLLKCAPLGALSTPEHSAKSRKVTKPAQRG